MGGEGVFCMPKIPLGESNGHISDREAGAGLNSDN